MAVRRAATNGLDRLPQSVVRHPSSVLLDQLGWRAAEVYDVVTWRVLCSALGPPPAYLTLGDREWSCTGGWKTLSYGCSVKAGLGVEGAATWLFFASNGGYSP